MIDPHLELVVGDGPWTICLWCAGRPVVLVGLERHPVIGDQFEIEGLTWVVVEDRDSCVPERLES